MGVQFTIVRGLTILAGVFWSLVYLLIIKRGFQDKTCGMPFVPFCASFSWEFIFSFIHPLSAPQLYINISWFMLDVVILFQIIRFRESVLTHPLLRRFFYPVFFLIFTMSFVAILSMIYELGDWSGKYTALAVNFMISVSFVSMLLNRNNVAGQSMYIALFKMAGTTLTSLLFFLHYPLSPILNFLYVATFIFDWIYIVLLFAKLRELGINPWVR